MARQKDQSETRSANADGESSINWSPVQIRIVSAILGFYLFLIVLAPLSNPISSGSLTGPISQFFQPLLQGFYLNHGYRFFGPEPGPTHLVEYELEFADEEETRTEVFPNPNEQWPRLLYHRWFMLSETIFAEYDLTPTEEAHREQTMQLAMISDQLKSEGHFGVADQVTSELAREKERYELARERVDLLTRSVARYLLEKNGAIRIELRIVERALPTPLDHVREVPMTDEKFLTRLRTIAKFEIDEQGELKALPVEDAFELDRGGALQGLGPLDGTPGMSGDSLFDRGGIQ